MSEFIGLTTTVPQEIILAGGATPCDLNNVLMSAPHPEKWVYRAEQEGFPETCCSWIKGIYAAVHERNIKTVVAVQEGDCAHTHILMDILRSEGVRIIPFSYPYQHSAAKMQESLEDFAEQFGVRLNEAEKVKQQLDIVRKKIAKLDEKTVKTGGYEKENFHFQLCSSDFNGNWQQFEHALDAQLQAPFLPKDSPQFQLRLGLIGVPPIYTDIFEVTQRFRGRIIYNEIPRQFAMLDFSKNLVEQYLNYTYPYSVDFRIADIQKQVELRRLDGLIHFVQAFCYRSLADILIRRTMNVPILTLEGNYPGGVDNRARLRLETFCEILMEKKEEEHA